ncbi:MAG: MalY/PatB family protein [Dysgonomonas sp.]
MSKYNFDQIINRKGTGAIKVDALKERYGDENLIPLWVADMDFLSPPAVSEAIITRARHGVFGYTNPSQGYFDAIVSWIQKHHNWQIKQEWVSFIPGIVKGIAFAVDNFTKEADKIIIQPPVYHPFRLVPTALKREIVNNPLVLKTDQYEMDMDDLKNKIDKSCKILILCNPHNPGGRVWTREELTAIADICFDNGILVISDEIHCDLAFKGHKHIPFASVSEKAAQNSITFMAPSKTFNIAGMASSYSIIPNDEIRERFHQYLEARELSSGDIFAHISAQTAYENGEEWLTELKEYLWNNISYVDKFLKEHIPSIKAMMPQASYLIWLDCRDLKLSQNELVSLFVNDAKLALNDGAMFGTEGTGFMRMNIGTPLSVIKEALNNLKKAVNK